MPYKPMRVLSHPKNIFKQEWQVTDEYPAGQGRIDRFRRVSRHRAPKYAYDAEEAAYAAAHKRALRLGIPHEHMQRPLPTPPVDLGSNN